MEILSEKLEKLEELINSLSTNFNPKYVEKGPVYNNTDVQDIIDLIDEIIEELKKGQQEKNQQCIEELERLKKLLYEYSNSFAEQNIREKILEEIRKIVGGLLSNCK